MYYAIDFYKCVMLIPQICHETFMYLYDVSKPTNLILVREVKKGDAGEFKRLVKKVKTRVEMKWPLQSLLQAEVRYSVQSRLNSIPLETGLKSPGLKSQIKSPN